MYRTTIERGPTATAFCIRTRNNTVDGIFTSGCTVRRGDSEANDGAIAPRLEMEVTEDAASGVSPVQPPTV